MWADGPPCSASGPERSTFAMMAQRMVRKDIVIEALPIRPQDTRLRVPAPTSRSACPKRSGCSSRSSASRPTSVPSLTSSSRLSSNSSSCPSPSSSAHPTLGLSSTSSSLPSSNSSSRPFPSSSSRPTLGPCSSSSSHRSSTSSSRPTLGPISSPSFSSLRGTSSPLVSTDPARIISRKQQKAFTSIWPIPKGPRRPQLPWGGPKPRLVQNQQVWSGPELEWARLDMEVRDQYFNRWLKRSTEPEGEPVGEPKRFCPSN
ncbi:putative protein TPRXL isoform X2 [Acanthopagrus latus]|uniref:putative protein TPRXL isoform X2 n=1 Tax=Acanthopagrus latus TaxID=8177 RepID=UPI00187C868E|nr:putative protein TPRXL isoform X2 [Acanthopagrus latus]